MCDGCLGRYRIPAETSFAEFLAGFVPFLENACHSLMRNADALKAMQVTCRPHMHEDHTMHVCV